MKVKDVWKIIHILFTITLAKVSNAFYRKDDIEFFGDTNPTL